MKEKTSSVLRKNFVPILFVMLCIISVVVSGQNMTYIVNETINRITRNAVLVISLLLPVVCGMGLNFGIVLGAMAAQLGLIIVTHWNIDGAAGLAAAGCIATVFAIVLGYLVGMLFNKVKGQEMITGMILSYAANGAYNIALIYLLGSVIPMFNPEIMLQTQDANGQLTYIGLRNTIELHSATKQALDKMWRLPLGQTALVVCLAGLVAACVVGWRVWHQTKNRTHALRRASSLLILAMVAAAVQVAGRIAPKTMAPVLALNIPLFTIALIALVCLLVIFILRTKLGQDIRTVGNNMHVAAAAGIDVDKTRIIANILCMVIAAWGQIIYLQNIGNIQTYNSHEQVGTYAVAALLVGGASLEKATIGQALTGTTLFHILFFTTPLAGMVIFHDAMYGEYFRVFLCYGVIAISLALYALKKNQETSRRLQREAAQRFAQT